MKTEKPYVVAHTELDTNKILWKTTLLVEREFNIDTF